MQLSRRRGALAALVRCLTSTVEMLPTTFLALSTTATLVKPSVFIRIRASASGVSELEDNVSRLLTKSEEIASCASHYRQDFRKEGKKEIKEGKGKRERILT